MSMGTSHTKTKYKNKNKNNCIAQSAQVVYLLTCLSHSESCRTIRVPCAVLVLLVGQITGTCARPRARATSTPEY
jgi:hypothetical protein